MKFYNSTFTHYLKILSFGLITISCFAASAINANAATRTWDGGGATNNFSEAANWSADTVPTSADEALFDATSTKNATIDTAFALTSMRMNGGYTGTISQSSSLTVSNFFDCRSGIFSGGSVNTSIGSLFLNGGTFNATSATLSLTNSSDYVLDFNGGTFNHNGGTVIVTGNFVYFRGLNVTLNNLTVKQYVINLMSAINVNGLLLLDTGASLTNSNVNVNGDVTFASGYTGGSATLTFGGTATKTTALGGTAISHPIIIDNPNITVTAGAAGETVVWSDKVKIQSGTLQQSAATYTFSGASAFNVPGFWVAGGTFNGSAANTNFNTTVTVSSGSLIAGTGDVGTNAAFCPAFPQANYYFQQSGGSFNGGAGNARFCDLRRTGGAFVAPSGNLTILNYGDFTGGTFAANNGTLIVENNVTIIAPGFTLNNVTLKGANNHGFGGTPKPIVSGTLNLDEGNLGSDVAVNGEVIYGANFTGGGGRLFFEGTTTRTINLPARNILLGMMLDNPNITVTTNGAGASSFTGDVEVKRGLLQQGGAAVNLTGNNLTVSGGTFQGSSSPLSVNGLIISGGAFQGGTGLVSGSNFGSGINQSGGTFSTGGDVAITYFTLSGGTFNAPDGLMTVVADWSHTAGGTFNGGTGTVKFTGYQTFNCMNTIAIDVAATETFNNLNIANQFCNRRIIAANDTLIVNGDFRISYGAIQNGRIRPFGTTTIDATNNGYTGSTVVEYVTPNTNFVINNPSSVVNMLPVEMNAANSTLTSTGAGQINFGAMTLLNGTLNQPNAVWDFTTVPGYTQSGGIYNGSAAQVNGANALSGGIFNGGTGLVNGGWSQSGGTFSTAGDMNVGALTLTGGTFNAPLGTLDIYNGFSHTTANGTFNARTGTVRTSIRAGVYQASFDVNVNEIFNNLQFNGTNNNANHGIGGGDTLIVNGTLNFNGRGADGGSIAANGNVLYTNFGGYQNASTLVKFQDTAMRTVTFSNDCTSYFQPTLVDNPNITINTGCDAAGAFLTWTSLDLRQGTVNAGNSRSGFIGNFTQSGGIFNGGNNATSPAISIGGDFTLSGGTFNAAPSVSFAANYTHTAGGTFNYGAGTAIFGGSGGTIDVNTTENFNNLAFQTTGSPKTIQTGDTLISNGDLSFQAGGVNGGTIDAKADVSVLNQFVGGTTNLNFSGAANQTFTNLGGITTGGAWTINKPNSTPLAENNFAPAAVSTLITAGNIGSVPSGIYPAFSVVSGNVQKGAGDFALGSLTLAAGTDFYSLSNGTFTLAGSVQNDGRLSLDANGAGCQADGILLRSSATGTQRAWNGAGVFRLVDVDVRDQAGSALITVYNGTNSGNNGANWIFDSNCAAPTAASVSISGRVVNANGRGIPRTQIVMVDGGGQIRYAMTNPFGFYHFADVPVGQTLTVTVSHKTEYFAVPTRILTVNEELTGINFTALER